MEAYADFRDSGYARGRRHGGTVAESRQGEVIKGPRSFGLVVWIGLHLLEWVGEIPLV